MFGKAGHGVALSAGMRRGVRFNRAVSVSILGFGLATFAVTARAQVTWQPYGTSGASEIAVSPGLTIWTIGKDSRLKTVLRNGDKIVVSPPGTPTRLATDPNGVPWVVTSDGNLWHWKAPAPAINIEESGVRPRIARASTWVPSPQKALDVAVGANGSVWAVGTDQRVMRFVNGTWEPMTGAGVRIAVDPSGNPWVVNSAGQIWKYSGSAWSLVDGRATDISIAPEGTVFILGTTPVAGGFEVLRLSGAAWEHILGGGGIAIAAGPHKLFVAQDAANNKVLTISSYHLAINYHPPTALTAATPTNNGPIVIALPGVQNITPPTPGSVGTSVIISPGSPVIVSTSGGNGLVVGGSSAPSVPGTPLVVSGGPFRPAGPDAIPGKLLCPIIGPGPKLLVGCAMFGRPARPLGAAPSTQCSAPSFGDPENGGECWSCPASYVRNVSAVTSTDACWKPVSENLSKATQTGRTGCGSGSFGDPRNGGECWSCPAGFGRTLDPVTAERACSKTIVGPFSVASFRGKIGTCSGSSFGDPIDGGTCWTCPAGYRRTLYAVTAENACAQTVATQYSIATFVKGCGLSYKSPPGYGTVFRDPRNGGECWVCPIPLKRSASPVNSTVSEGMFAACSAGGNTDLLVWQLGQYPEPGLPKFMSGLLGTAFADPKAVDAFLLKRANGDPNVKRAIWTSMINEPAGSPELKALIFASLLTVAKQDNPDIPAAAALRDFEEYMRARRVYVAKEAVAMYNNWLDVDAYNAYQAAKTSSGMSGMSSDVLGKAATDYKGYAWSAAVPDSLGIAFVLASVALSGSGGPDAVGTTMNTTRSFQVADVASVVEGLVKALDQGIDKGSEMVEKAATLSKMASGVKALKGAQGALLGLEMVGAVINLSEAITTLVEKDKIAAEYQNYVAEMEEPVSVKKMLESGKPDDKQALLLYWALATSPYKASDLLGSNPVTSTNLCAAGQWEFDCNAAKDIIRNAAKQAGN